MDFNTLLLRLGIDPSNFINQLNEPIIEHNCFIYEVEQRTDIRECPKCYSNNATINNYNWVTINASETDQIRDIVRIKKVRFKCKSCGTTFTPVIKGIERYKKVSSQLLQMIFNDFTKSITFSEIAQRYGISKSRVIQIFDEKIKYVPRLKLSEVVCVDEIKFSKEIDQKYCCVLYDFKQRVIIDIIKNRQMPYLNEYFSNIRVDELNKVKFFISDMYDAYASICRKYFTKAIHIVDLFHVISQLTNAVNRLRVKTMNLKSEKGSIYYNFMKQHWKHFLCRKENIPDKFYTYSKTGEIFHYDDLVFECIKLDQDLWTGYNCLQDLFHYHLKWTFEEAYHFIEYISQRLINSDNEILMSVGRTYHKWRVEIANGFAKNQNKIHYTNAIAESINNHLKTIIKDAYGYRNFERFRKRAMLISTYKK